MIQEITQLSAMLSALPEQQSVDGVLNEILPVMGGVNASNPELLGKDNLARINTLPELESKELSRQLADTIREKAVGDEYARFGIPLTAMFMANLMGSELNLINTNIPQKGWELTSNAINNMWQWADKMNGVAEVAAKTGVVIADVYVFIAGVTGIIATADLLAWPVARLASKIAEPLAHAKYQKDVTAFLNAEDVGNPSRSN